MVKAFLLCFILFLFFPLYPLFASIRINEIYPAPVSGEFEWIELYNPDEEAIDISHYSLSDLANNKILIPSPLLESLGFTIATSTGILNNTGDTLFLKNDLGEAIQIATYSGSFTSSKSYASCPDGSLDFAVLSQQTKNASNLPACPPTPTPTPTFSEPTLAPTISPSPTPTVVISPTSSTPTPTMTPTPTTIPSPTPTMYVNPQNIYISEVMVNPVSGEKEWIEIYNDNDIEVTLFDWFIDDEENAGSSMKSISLSIPPKGYVSVDLTSSVFNNTQDSVRLLNSEKLLVDSFEYAETEQNKTYGRTSFSADEFCLQEPSKNEANNPCINPTAPPTLTPTRTPAPSRTPTPTKTPAPLPFSPSLTPIQIKNSVVTSFNTPITFSSLPEGIQNIASNESPPKSDGNILGEKTYLSPSPPKKTTDIGTFSFASISHSLLTLGLVLLKMKKHA